VTIKFPTSVVEYTLKALFGSLKGRGSEGFGRWKI